MIITSAIIICYGIITSSTALFVKADSIDDAVTEWMTDNNVRAVSVAFYDGSDPKNIIDIRRGYGKVSSSDTSADVTPDTPFQMASVSKVFTASAVAVLVDKGIINTIEDDICDTVPSNWGRSACRNPNFPDTPVTWRMLMTHRSGLVSNIPLVVSPDTGDIVFAQYAPSNLNLRGIQTYGNPSCPLTDVQNFYRSILTNDVDANTTIGGGTIDWYETMKEDSFRRGSWTRWIRPGQIFMYSNYAYGYLVALVEMASSMSFESFCQQYIFEPLAMTNTTWFRENLIMDVNNQAMPLWYNRRTSSYTDYGHSCYIDYGSGQLYTTVNDLSKFLYTMMVTKGVPALWSESVGDAVLACAEPCPRYNRNGYGWQLLLDNNNNKRQKRRWNFGTRYNWTNGGYHFGGDYGISTFIMVLPSSNVYVAVQTNMENVNVELFAGIVEQAATTGTAATAKTNT